MVIDNIKLNDIISKKDKFLHFIPNELSNLLDIKSIRYKDINLKTNYIIDILNQFILKYYFKEESNIQLSSTILKERYGHNYNYYIDYMLEMGWIKLVRNYLRGTNSRIYSLDQKLLTDIIRVENFDRILLKKWKSRYHEFQLELSNNIDRDIKEKLIYDLHSVEIDLKKSLFYLSSLSDISKIALQKNRYSVESIKAGHIFYHFDKYGRLHSNFTILKSFIRKNCLLIGGEETVEIDIKNSQPFILSRLLLKSSESLDRSELDFFVKLVNNGKFYQYLQDAFGLDKVESKEMVFKVFFGKNWNSKYDKHFKSHFPTIYNWIKLYKRENGGYKTLSWKLQGIESDLIFNKIIRSITSINPDISVITVHDSIICKKSHLDIVERVFNYHINRF
jgi:hypothetical protein